MGRSVRKRKIGIKAVDLFDRKGDLKPEKKEELPRGPRKKDERLSRAERDFQAAMDKLNEKEKLRVVRRKQHEEAERKKKEAKKKPLQSKAVRPTPAPKRSKEELSRDAAIPSFGGSDSDDDDDAEKDAVDYDKVDAGEGVVLASNVDDGEKKKKNKKKRKKFGEMREGESFKQFNERIKQETRETLIENYQTTRRKKQKLNEFMQKKKEKKKEKERVAREERELDEKEAMKHRPNTSGGGQGGMDVPQFGEQAIEPPRFKKLPGERKRVVLSDAAPLLQGQ